tara:strand:+ start:130 stop:879 length:750 start_codon:yes stop_codon:yes gene_type:complete
MKDKFKLKHYDILSIAEKDKQDIATLMVDILGYKNSFFGKAKWFLKNFMKVRTIVDEINRIGFDYKKLNENSYIKKPASVDHISYEQMLNLQNAVSQKNDLTPAKHIARVIAIATYSDNRETLYKLDSKIYKRYEEDLLKQPLFDMMALYNWILEDLKATSDNWTKVFFSVEVIDKDYQKHAGTHMHQFNVVNTLKNICADFGYTEKEAWQVSYYLVMTNNYEKASSNWIQANIQAEKEAEIERNRKNK